MTKEELIEMLDTLKKSSEETVGNRIDTEQKYTILANISPDSFRFVIGEAIKALEQPTISCNATTEEIAQSFISDVEAVKDYLPKCDSMEFPKTFDEFANDYGFTDDEEIYTNGSHSIPVFRVKQWLEHMEQQPSDDCISRVEALSAIRNLYPGTPFVKLNLDKWRKENKKYFECEDIIKALPPVIPTHGTCKDCKHNKADKYGNKECLRLDFFPDNVFYCADFEKRGSEK